MKKILLDTSFILSCIKQKIDFFDELEMHGMKILIPDKVIKEIKGLKKESALNILKANKFQKIELKGRNTDKAIINFANKNPEIIIATLDREIKTRIKNHKMILRGKKKLEIV
ncbi:MAG: PIN domain-containing protein [archaeon]